MRNEKIKNTTEVIIIPNDKMQSKDLKTFSQRTRDDNDYAAILNDFTLSHEINMSSQDSNDIYKMIAHIVESGYIVMIYSGLDNILEVYFPNLSLENVSIKQLCQFSGELKKKDKVRYVFAHRYDSKESAHIYNYEIGCNFYNMATGDDAKKHMKVLSYNKPACCIKD